MSMPKRRDLLELWKASYKHMVRDQGLFPFADAAHDQRTDPEELRRLVVSGYRFVLLAVAKHPRAEPDPLMSCCPCRLFPGASRRLPMRWRSIQHCRSRAWSDWRNCCYCCSTVGAVIMTHRSLESRLPTI